MPANNKKLVIGILGGIASGKSQVAQMLAELGAEVLNADQVGHQVLLEPEIKSAIEKRFGSSVFDADQQIDRQRLAGIVFGEDQHSKQALLDLEKITHPAIGKKLAEKILEIRQNELTPAIVLDAPVMLKSGWNCFCDSILFVASEHQDRVGRAAERGWSQADFDAREANQEKLNEKQKMADYIIYNTGTIDELRQQVKQFWTQLIVNCS
ncbi:MAG: dephospho-CoA kinase [Blastopirellula sp.]|nr:MAG: dephospho-CoA kinase [Blastopirellula sp.]